MSLFHAVGIGPLNIDMHFKIPPENFDIFNKDLKRKRIQPFILNNHDTGKLKDFDKTEEIAEKYGKRLPDSLGGSATITITTLSRMGFDTGYLGLIGYDTRFLLENLKIEDVHTGMVFIGGLGSGRCMAVSDGRDRALRVYLPNSNDLLGIRHLTNPVLKNLKDSKIIHMSSFSCSLVDEPLKVQIKIAEEFGKDVMISFSPDELYTRGLGLKVLEPILKNSYVLFLSRKNIQNLTGEDYIEGSKKLLDDKYCRGYIATTLGGGGAHLRYPGGEFLATVSPLSEIETRGITGAGDAFAGGFLYGLLKEKSPEECMYLGNKVANIRLRGLERKAYQQII